MVKRFLGEESFALGCNAEEEVVRLTRKHGTYLKKDKNNCIYKD
jgi:hypothetical protein